MGAEARASECARRRNTVARRATIDAKRKTEARDCCSPGKAPVRKADYCSAERAPTFGSYATPTAMRFEEETMNTAHAKQRSGGWLRWGAATLGLAALVTTAGSAAADRVSPTLVCSTGPSGQRFNAEVTAPDRVTAGAVYTVRIDGVSSGKISHFGLNYLHDMTVEYELPPGAAYVEGSARLLPGTGTANVLASPRLTERAGVVVMALPGHVDEGTSYTPPSIELKLRAVGASGSSQQVSLRRFRLTANAIVVGDVAVSCAPAAGPYPVASTLITPAAQALLP
jgi:hypothetical protein